MSELARYGFSAGEHERWCATCTRTFNGGEKAFKCYPCASTQAKEVNRECRKAGYEFGSEP